MATYSRRLTGRAAAHTARGVRRLPSLAPAAAVALAALFASPFAAAQDGSCFADLAATRNYTAGQPVQATPTPDGAAVLYLRSGPRDAIQRLYELTIATRTERELVTPEALLRGAAENLSPEERARRERQRITAQGFVSYELSKDGRRVLLSLGGKLYTVERASGEIVELPGVGWIAPRLSPDGERVAALRDGELYAIDIAERVDLKLTHGAGPTLTHGEAEFVAQEEMDRSDGFWWSPDSRHLAYEEADLSAVELHYVADPLHPEVPPVEFRYPRAGTANASVRLGIVPADGGDTVWVPWDTDAYPYLVRVSWRDGPLTLVVENRSLTDERVLEADHRTGKTRALWAERDDAWLETPQWDFPHRLADGSGFLWASERSGQWQLERRSADGDLVNAVTPADFRFDRLVDVDLRRGSVVVQGGTDRLSRGVWRLPIAGGRPVALADARGLNAASFGEQHAIFAHRYSLADGSAGTDVRNARGALLAALPSAAEEPPRVPAVDYLTVGAREFDALVVRPRDFDAARRYPVILSVYAGPAAKEVTAATRESFERQCMADRGFIVATLDNRGTPGRDRAWLRAVKGNAIDIPLEDQIDGLRALAARIPQMDLSRTGVVGWSFGGYFAAMAAMRRPDVFAAAVAGAPVADWEDYDTYYTERYLQHPAENAEGYRASNVLTYAGRLERPLLIIHGVTDDNVYFQHSMKLVDALLKAGKPYELLLLPGTHMLADPEINRNESERVMAFFGQHLGGAR
jgi:dipeptidyl-peptidase 4